MTAAVLASEERAMIRAVLLDPADDAVRLILADWYEEHGRLQRANQIRHSVRDSHKRILGPYQGSGGYDLATREVWRIDPRAYGECDQIVLSRGFISEWHGPLATFLTNVERLFSEQPIERVVLTDRVPVRVSYLVSGLTTYRWRVWGDEEGAHTIPFDLWVRLGLDGLYTSATDAHADLSQACVAYGRSLVDLPPMPERKEPQ